MYGFFSGQAKAKAAEAEFRRICEGISRDARCLQNFRDYHGFDAGEFANMAVIRRDYCLPWRKSPIPKVCKRKETQ